jgi:hypothetical protein
VQGAQGTQQLKVHLQLLLTKHLLRGQQQQLLQAATQRVGHRALSPSILREQEQVLERVQLRGQVQQRGQMLEKELLREQVQQGGQLLEKELPRKQLLAATVARKYE